MLKSELLGAIKKGGKSIETDTHNTDFRYYLSILYERLKDIKS